MELLHSIPNDFSVELKINQKANRTSVFPRYANRAPRIALYMPSHRQTITVIKMAYMVSMIFCALVGAFHSASPPKRAKGNHLTLDCESSPWAFHPCRVLRQLRREVSLSCPDPRRLAGGNPALEAAFLAQHLCFSPRELPHFVPLTGQVVTAYCPPGSSPEECIR